MTCRTLCSLRPAGTLDAHRAGVQHVNTFNTTGVERLFGVSFPLEAITDLRVRRIRTRGAMKIALGVQPTWLTVTLQDGRRLEARSRGNDPEHDAIEALLHRVAAPKANEALRAIASGKRYAFGSIVLDAHGIEHAGRLTRWDEIAGFAVRHGGLVWDDARGRLAGEVMLDDVPFADALRRVLAARLPGRDYEQMPRGQGPRHNAFSITARNRIPGTYKYALHVVCALVPLLVLVFGGYYAIHRASLLLERRAVENEPKTYLGSIDQAATALANPSTLASAPACTRTTLARRTHLVAADKSAVSYKGTGTGVWHQGDLRGLRDATNFYVWTYDGRSVHVAQWDAPSKRMVCAVTRPVRLGETPAIAAQVAAEEGVPLGVARGRDP